MLAIDLSNRIALVTGATGQLGRVMVRTLAAAGARVAIVYHKNQPMAEKLLAELRAREVPATAAAADVTDLDSICRMRDEVTRTLGAPDIIVNNAVAQYKWVSVLEQPAEDYESQFKTCVLHNVHMAKAFVPAMIERKFGRIVAINTECAVQCTPSQSAYVSGKRGMDGVLRVLAREVGPHQITVNQVAPGWMYSDREREADLGPDHGSGYAKNVPLRRRGTDLDIAHTVAFLASDLANFITGQFISVSGGNVMPSI